MKAAQKIIFISLASTLLCACSHMSKEQQQQSYDYSLAVNKESKLQPTKYVPVPMPGQLMSLKKQAKSKKIVGQKAIENANKKARKQPTSSNYINSIMTFDYMPGALYEIYSAPLNVTDIQFQSNEHIVAVGAGDTLRWQVSKTYSGIGASRKEHLLVKPTDDGLTNSLVVTTDKRTYHMLLHSTPKTYMASITWRYPDSDGLLKHFDDDEDPGMADVMSGVNVNQLNFNYAAELVRGSIPDWYPQMIFNDGKKTYIQFSKKAQEAPALFIGDKKSSEVTNYRVQGNYYIIDRVITHAQLHSGPQKNKTIIQISTRAPIKK